MDALKKIIIAIVYVFAMIGFVAVVNQAKADYSVKVIKIKNNDTNETKQILHLTGDFDEGIGKDVEYLLDKHTVSEAVLYSPGGLGYEGYVAAGALSKHEVPVRVAKETYCISACAIAFIGGTDYKVNDGILAFHKGWVMDEPWKNQNEAFAAGQAAGAYDAYFLTANGFSFELSSLIQQHTNPDKFIVFTHEDQLNEFYVRSEENNIDDYLKEKDIDVKIWGTKEIQSHLSKSKNNGNWSIVSTIEEKTNTK